MKRAFLPVALLLTVMNASAQQTSVPNLITASGTAESKMTPDMATIRIGVETQAKTAKEAQAGTNALAQKLLAAALKVVPDKKAFQTSDLSLNPEIVYSNVNGVPTQKITGYRARNILTVRLDDVAKVGPLVDAVTDAGATNVDSIAFGLKDEKPARRQALMDAVQDARDKAEAMAAGLGLKIFGVASIDEGGGPIVRPYMQTMLAERREPSAPVMPGEVSVGVSVTVRFLFTQTPANPDNSRGR